MAEEHLDDNFEEKDDEFRSEPEADKLENVIRVSGMYEEWFLDYASYVILERAVPHIHDGLKPVQRRILHSLKEMDDGRYHKVANVIGNTMKYHPHGDASIGDAMVQIGQKDLLLDTQGNWGNIFTGDRAAASRYIEVRLSKFGLEVAFNNKTTNWQASYDGRGREPVTLPVKFPLLLAQGVEGIAVGLACKILPHNFIELIDASIAHLQGKKFKLLPDFPTGGMADFSNYNDGLRGGKVRVRAKITAYDKKTLLISDIPFGTNTTSLIDSIIKAVDKGKIKVRKIEDNTAEIVEIMVHLANNVSPDKTIDALYAFTDCEVSISPNSCVILDDKPLFLGVCDILKHNTDNTLGLLKLELEIRKGELMESLLFASLEKIFIEEKIYIEFDGKTYEEAIAITFKRLEPYIERFYREITNDDVVRLLEIRMRRITKHDGEKANDYMRSLEDELKQVQFDLDNLVDFAIAYYKRLKDKYAKGKERKTEIRSFENIDAVKVAVANTKLYVNRVEGFAGHGLKKNDAEFVCDCSDIDDIIVIRRDGKMSVSKISEKSFFGKDIIHIAVWKKGDERTIYNLVYQDGPRGYAFMKRFAVNAITRDKDYDLSAGTAGSKVLYLSVNPNGEAEIVKVVLRPKPKLKVLKFDLDFADLAIKGRSAKGNTLTKNSILKIEKKEDGTSTLGAMKVWWDDSVRRLNIDGRGELLGAFNPEDKILTVMQSGHYRLSPFAKLETKFDEDLVLMTHYSPKKPKIISAIYWEGEKKQFMVKRFEVEPTDNTEKILFISESEGTKLEVVSSDDLPRILIQFDKRSNDRDDEEIALADFISVKGMKALGNKLTSYKVKNINLLEPFPSMPESTENSEIEPQELEESADNNQAKVKEEKIDSTDLKKTASEKEIENSAPKRTAEKSSDEIKDVEKSDKAVVESKSDESPVVVEFPIKKEVPFEIELPPVYAEDNNSSEEKKTKNTDNPKKNLRNKEGGDAANQITLEF